MKYMNQLLLVDIYVQVTLILNFKVSIRSERDKEEKVKEGAWFELDDESFNSNKDEWMGQGLMNRTNKQLHAGHGTGLLFSRVVVTMFLDFHFYGLFVCRQFSVCHMLQWVGQKSKQLILMFMELDLGCFFFLIKYINVWVR